MNTPLRRLSVACMLMFGLLLLNANYLQVVKAKYPDKTEATLLLEKDIPYDALVQVMDTMRILEQRQNGQLVQAELFPDVSIGDAPEADAPAAGGKP